MTYVIEGIVQACSCDGKQIEFVPDQNFTFYRDGEKYAIFSDKDSTADQATANSNDDVLNTDKKDIERESINLKAIKYKKFLNFSCASQWICCFFQFDAFKTLGPNEHIRLYLSEKCFSSDGNFKDCSIKSDEPISPAGNVYVVRIK